MTGRQKAEISKAFYPNGARQEFWLVKPACATALSCQQQSQGPCPSAVAQLWVGETRLFSEAEALELRRWGAGQVVCLHGMGC